MKRKKQDVKKIKANVPVSLIIYGGNNIGQVLAQALLQEQSKVILVDKFTKKTKEIILKLKELGDIDFVDINGLEDLLRKVNRIDYIFYNHNQYLLQKESFSSQDFLQQSNYLNYTLRAATKFGAAFSLLSTIKYNKLLLESSQISKITQEYSPQELQKYAETLVAEFHDQSKLNARVLRLGTILGEINDLQYYPRLHQLFTDAATKDSITIKGDGLESHYLIHIKDALFGILKLTFSNATKGSVISLCNNREYSEISIAYKLLELNPKATEIKFEPTTKNKKIIYEKYVPTTNAEKFGWKQTVEIAEAFKETLKQIYQENNKKWIPKTIKTEKQESIKSTVREIKTPLGKFLEKVHNTFARTETKKEKLSLSQKLIYTTTIIVFLFAFYFFLGPILSASWSSYQIYKNTKKLQNNYFSNNINENRLIFNKINKHTKILKYDLQTLHWAFKLTKKDKLYTNLNYLIYIGETTSEGGDLLTQGLNPTFEYIKNFEPAISTNNKNIISTKEYTQYLKGMKSNEPLVLQGLNKLEDASYTIDLIQPDVFPTRFRNYIIRLKVFNNKYGDKISVFENVIPELPTLLGLNKRQVYLILLENQTEIRSTGGWISAYAIIGLEHGQIRQFDIGDIYDLDGQIKLQGRRIEPPEGMKKNLEVQNWTLSLANWDPELSNTKKAAEFFLKRAHKAYRVDGLITVDLVFVEKLLNTWHGITIPGEAEPITSNSLYTRLFALHKNFKPGEEQKSTFLTNLTSEILRRLFQKDKTQSTMQLLQIIVQSLNEKHMMIYIENPKIEPYLSQHGWSGTLLDKYFTAPFEINWNWGANKANKFIETTKDININIISSESLEYSYEVHLQNNSTSEIYPQGTYKDFIRIYLPHQAKINSVSGFKDDIYSVEDKTRYKIVEGWLEVPVLTTRSFKIDYTLTRDNTFNTFPLQTYGTTHELNLTLYKHPGFSTIPYTIKLSYPANWNLKTKNPWTISNNTASVHLNVNTDTDLSATWTEN